MSADAPRAEIEYLDVEQGEPVRCPVAGCGLPVTLRIDRYGCCQRLGGCAHIVVTEQCGGTLRLGFCDVRVAILPT